MKKRILSIILTLAMALSLLPASALAAGNSFGVFMGGTQLEAGKYYRTNDDGTVEETAAENYEIYFIADDTNVYTLTINGAAEHEITFGSGTTLTVVDYTTTPDGNRATHVARDGGASMTQLSDSDVADETFVVMTSGTTDSTLAPGQTLTVAYPDDDGGYTNACPIQAAAGNDSDIALLLRGNRGYNNSVILNPGVAVTMDGILYEFTNDVDSRALTMDFHMNLDSPTSDILFASGTLKISAPRAYTDIFNGYDFAEGCTEAEFTFSTDGDGHPGISLTGGAIALDEGESVTVNGVLVVGAGSTVVTMDEATGSATVDGSAIIGGVLETSGNPGDDDYRALVEIDEHSAVTLQEGAAESLETTYFSLANGGTVTVPAATSIIYNSNSSESYLDLIKGTITVNGVDDTVITSYTDYSGGTAVTRNIEFSLQDTLSCTLKTSGDSVILSYISGDVNVAMDEGSELLYDTDDGTKVIKARSHADDVTIREDGSIWAGETTAQPNDDGSYVVGAAHQSSTLGGFTVYGNPDGVSYNEETGVLTIHTKGVYEITTEGGTARSSGVTSDTIHVKAGGSITLKNVRIEAAEGNALTIQANEVSLIVEGSNSLTGGDSASGLAHTNESLSIFGSGTLAVSGSGASAIKGNISISGPAVIATGGTGGNGDDGKPGIAGNVMILSGSLTAAGGSAVPGSNGVGGTGITGAVIVKSGTASVAGGANSSGSTAQATGGNVYANKVTLTPTAENTAFTLRAEESNIHLSGIGGNANITLSGGSLTVQDASGNKQTITSNNTENDTTLNIGSTGSITGETDHVTIDIVQSAPTVTVRYKVTTDAENGTIQIGSRYQRGETVTFTITPDTGYVLENVTVTRKSGAEVSVTEKDGIYTFEMPASGVTVNAKFVLAFEDIARDHQFYEAIEWVYTEGLMLGKTETTFDRVNPVTRQQVWRILARLINGEDPADMAAAKEWVVVQGIADGTNPGTAATREEFVTMMWIALGKPAADTSILAQFPDADAISPDASTAMAWAVSEGIVGSYEDGTLRPTATATRGAFAAILYRYYAK